MCSQFAFNEVLPSAERDRTAIADHRDPSAPTASWPPISSVGEAVQRTDHRCESGRNGTDDIRNPQLSEETVLEALDFNEITNLGRGQGGRGRQNSMCRLELAA